MTDGFDMSKFSIDITGSTNPLNFPDKPVADPQKQKLKDEPKQVEPYIRRIPIRWWLRVLALQKKHRRSNVIDLASAIIYLDGLKHTQGLNAACLKKFHISRRGSQRNLRILEEAGLVVVRRVVGRNRPPFVDPVFDTANGAGEGGDEDE